MLVHDSQRSAPRWMAVTSTASAKRGKSLSGHELCWVMLVPAKETLSDLNRSGYASADRSQVRVMLFFRAGDHKNGATIKGMRPVHNISSSITSDGNEIQRTGRFLAVYSQYIESCFIAIRFFLIGHKEFYLCFIWNERGLLRPLRP